MKKKGKPAEKSENDSNDERMIGMLSVMGIESENGSDSARIRGVLSVMGIG
jgi:hypothetical protein